MQIPATGRNATRAGLLLATLSLLLTLGIPASGAGAASAAQCRFHGAATAQTSNGHRTTTVRICTDRPGMHRLRATAAHTVPKYGHVGAATSRLVTLHRSRPWRITSQTHTARVVLLKVIRARAVMARATATTRRHRQLVGRTVLTDLRIQGHAMPTHPARNQTVTLPGIGTVVLNHQVRTRHGRRISIAVTALRLVVGKNNPLHLPSGVITIGHTSASVRLPAHHA